ncbi:helix-turn-helix domain-containing protein [Crenobacter luteus]|uniref:Helix-turn-helix domain-containing protein n=1 Tax=Crenobacter luteus TaxID=1452487 RepID=A0A165EL06_9NEIS|nr:helix-turn-helix domain-containing protein [Crenobacter luteus]KZE25332.1 hypothetical protein AVW16_03255 [Crenobacter luteus]
MAAYADRNPERLLTRPEAADFLGVSPYTLNEWASSGRYALRFYRIGRRCMYRMADLEAFIASRAVCAGQSEGA